MSTTRERDESEHIQLMLQYNNIRISMQKLIPNYKRQVKLLIERHNQLEKLSEEIINGNTHLDAEDSDFFSTLNNTIKDMINTANQYRGNGFEDAIDNASDMNKDKISIILVAKLDTKNKKLIELSSSITDYIEGMTQCLTNLAERKIQIIDKINNKFNVLQKNVVQLEETHKKIIELQALLTNKFKSHEALSFISRTLPDYNNDLQIQQNQHRQSCLRDQSLSEISKTLDSQNQLSDRVNAIKSTLDQYLIDITQQYNTESKTKTTKVADEKKVGPAEINNIKDELLQLKKDIVDIKSTMESTRKIHEEIDALDRHLQTFKVYQWPNYQGIESLQEFARFKSTIAESSVTLNTISSAHTKYQTLIDDSTLLLKKINVVDINTDEYHNIEKQIIDKKNKILTCKQEIKEHVKSIETINKKSARQLATAKSAITQLPAAIKQSITELEKQYQRKQNDIEKDYDDAINSLSNEQENDDSRIKQNIKQHIPIIKKTRNEFNTTLNTSLSEANKALDVYSNTIASIILSWLSSWIPFIKNTKKDELAADVARIKLTQQLFNNDCNQLQTLFDDQNHHLIETQMRVIKNKLVRSRANYQDNSFISRSYDKLQTISTTVEQTYQEYEKGRIQNINARPKALLERDSRLTENTENYMSAKKDANTYSQLADKLISILPSDAAPTNSPLKESPKANNVIIDISSFFKNTIEETSKKVGRYFNDKL